MLYTPLYTCYIPHYTSVIYPIIYPIIHVLYIPLYTCYTPNYTCVIRPIIHPTIHVLPMCCTPHYTCVMCVCVFSSHSFWTSIDVPAGVTHEEGNTGFSIHLLSAVLALIFLARRIQPFLSLVDREVDFVY